MVTELDRREAEIRTADDLVDFARFLAEETVEKNPEFRERFLSDALDGLASWLEDLDDKPEHPDWKFVGRLLSTSVFYD